MSKATSQAFSSYRRNRTVLSFHERHRLTVFVSNGTVAVMAQRGVSLKSALTCYEKNKLIFFFIWAVIDFMTINISWFLLNIKQHPSPISRKPQTVLNGWMAWIVCIVLYVCLPHVQGDCSYILTPRATGARRPRGPNVKKNTFIGVMELVSLCCNRDFTSASSYGLGWYKYAIATQWYQFHTTDAWWFSLSIKLSKVISTKSYLSTRLFLYVNWRL